ncbi:hypothetical protein SAMN05421741_11353 [Paenimyroides ummariense]|uniref:Uncharacterized protein n=1 Tax=Paenimyroides ummariense TaxID=913024 RepID=A0A1I5CTD3_9FLAO|nr:hypothetical protein [Paenimyroides ummariense]SFN90203.1 hypothetical protein SAMN05421741_11353 [Paenimyroides ummariense]
MNRTFSSNDLKVELISELRRHVHSRGYTDVEGFTMMTGVEAVAN